MPTELTPEQEYERDYYAPDATDWDEVERAKHTVAECWDRAQATAKRRAAVTRRFEQRLCVQDFEKEMLGRTYGPAERAEAFAWFEAGWKSSRARVMPGIES